MSGSGTRVVAVDDDGNVRKVIERTLCPPNFEALVFSSASAALESCRVEAPQVIISDYLMPGMGGEALLRAIRSSPALQHVPFLFLTAVRLSAEAVAEMGADGLLRKPFPVADLRRTVQNVLVRSGRRGPAGTVSEILEADHEHRPETEGSEPLDDGDPQLADVARGHHRFPYGRFSSVVHRGQRFQLLTEQVDSRHFAIATVITNRGLGIRRVESSLGHPLARTDDYDQVKVEIDFQHDTVVSNLDRYVLETRRSRLWESDARYVSASSLVWLIRTVAGRVLSALGDAEGWRILESSLSRVAGRESALRCFHVTRDESVACHADELGRVPRAAVAALAAWSVELSMEAFGLRRESAGASVLRVARERLGALADVGFLTALARMSGADPYGVQTIDPEL